MLLLAFSVVNVVIITLIDVINIVLVVVSTSASQGTCYTRARARQGPLESDLQKVSGASRPQGLLEGLS